MTDAGWRLADIVARLGGELRGENVRVLRVAPLTSAGPEAISFLANPKLQRHLAATNAGAVIVAPKFADACPRPCIVHANPYAYYARVVGLLNPPRPAPQGIHPSAVVQSTLPASVSVGPQAVVGRNVRCGERVVLHPGCVIGDEVTLGDDACVYPRAVIYAGCVVGCRAIIHAGAVIGSDGFGFAKDGDDWVKIQQIGRVVLGDDVEVGACTTIDRGALDDTVIGRGVKLDNLIQVAHNVRIGEYTAIAGCTGIAGSTTIGARCTIGGAGMIVGHIDIADGVHVSGGTLISKSVRQPGHYTGVYPFEKHEDWLHNAAQTRHLDALAARVRELESRLKQQLEQS